MADPTTAVLLPMQLTAWILNNKCCESKAYKIGPLTQPNYTFLRLNENLLTSDTLDHVDIHSASPADRNPRVWDLGQDTSRTNRLGVYLHWTLPQIYRKGMLAAGEAATSKDQTEIKRMQGYPASSSTVPDDPTTDYSVPDFRPVPNRWLITRRITSQTSTPVDRFQAWIVESDRIVKLDEIPFGMDIENDFAPFINSNPDAFDPNNISTNLIEGQAEFFIGKKTPLDQYPQDVKNAKYLPLNILTSANPLFADCTHHNMNVFTICDNLLDKSGNQLSDVTADYSVIGWHSSSDDDPMTTYIDPKLAQTDSSNADRLASCSMQLKDLATDPTQRPPPVTSWLAADTRQMASRILCHGTMYGVRYQSNSMPQQVVAETSGLKMKKSHPVAVGSTSIDATLAYCRAHLNDDLTDPTMGPLEQDLVGLSSLLAGAEGDDVEGFRAATDENLKQAFTKIDAGLKWVFKDQTAPGVKPTIPDLKSQVMTDLIALNSLQQTLDTATRELSDLRWTLFAKWWDFVSGVIDHAQPIQYRDALDDARGKIQALESRTRDLTSTRDSLRNSHTEFECVAAEYFYQKKDPTVLFSNVGRGWEPDFSDISQVRLSSNNIPQTVQRGLTEAQDNDFSNYMRLVTQPGANNQPRIDGSLINGIVALLSEFYSLSRDYTNVNASTPSTSAGTASGSNISTTTSTTPGNPAATTDSSSKKDTDPPKPVPVTQILPYYHTTTPNQVGRDYWNNTQPWKPIMIEWEAIYYHVPFEDWSFKEYNNLSQWASTCVHYGPNKDLGGLTDDRRHIAGRNILTPQTSSALSIALQTVFNNTNQQDLIASFAAARPSEKILDKSEADQITWLQNEQKQLLQTVSTLEMVSSTMTGLTSHLLTLHEGTHLKPTVRLPNKRPVPIDAAVTVLKYVYSTNNSSEDQTRQLATQAILAMQDQTRLTPYGSSVQFESSHSPLKPVTHGQLVFTKVNVIDKFGQVISTINPATPRYQAPWDPLVPCLADSFFPGLTQETLTQGFDPTTSNARPNTVVAQNTAACPFVALPPGINQPARLNAHFVKKNTNGGWSRCSEWDDPVWGWIVVNYADAGLQIFFADGTFYREIRLGGALGTTGGRKYLPFDKPSSANPDRKREDVTRLEFFISKLTEPNKPAYFQAIVDMVLQSLDDKQAHAPRSYATNASAIVGKPLALVNAGWSLELANPENANWSTVNTALPERTLLNNGTLLAKDSMSIDFTGVNATSPPKIPITPAGDLSNKAGRAFSDSDVLEKGYTFPIKIGDAERSFDGVVGYFGMDPTHQNGDTTTCDLNLDNLYTYFVDSLTPTTKSQSDPRISLLQTSGQDLTTPLTLQPYHLNSYVGSATASSDFQYHDAQLEVLGLIIDPFLPVHAYSAILPNKSIMLPPWTVEQALNRMTAFWQAGPLVVTQDIPLQYNKALALGDYYTQQIAPSSVNSSSTSATTAKSAPVVSSALAVKPAVSPNPVASATPETTSKAPTETTPAASGSTPPAGGIIPPTSNPAVDTTLPLVSIPLAPPVGSSAGAEAVYRWLQPYWVPTDKTQSVDPNLSPDPTPKKETVPPGYVTRFNAMGISNDSASGADAATLRLEKGPYTAIEGFVQVAKPLGLTSGQVVTTTS